jgi:hypothetical protein
MFIKAYYRFCQPDHPEQIIIALMCDTITFTVQFQDQIEMISSAPYAAGIKEVRTDIGRMVVDLVGFDDEAEVELVSIQGIPHDVAHIELQAMEVKLGCVAACRVPPRVNLLVCEMVRGKAMWAHLMHSDGRAPALLLTEEPNGNAPSINLELARRNIASFHPPLTLLLRVWIPLDHLLD